LQRWPVARVTGGALRLASHPEKTSARAVWDREQVLRPGPQTKLPASADIDLPATLSARGWGLIGADVFEDQRRLVVRMELPGMAREDFQIDVLPDVLTVRGEKNFEPVETEGRWRVLQRAYGAFQRRIPLPVAVKVDEVRATYRGGVLAIELPKAEIAPPQAVNVRVD
jgi:HSP20 family protein